MANLRVTGCHFTIHLDIYDKDIMFSFGYSVEKVARLMEGVSGSDLEEIRKWVVEEKCNNRGITFIGRSGAVLINIPKLPQTPDHFNSLSHEIFHAAEGVMTHIGNPLLADGGNSESWAYLIGYITGQVHKNLVTIQASNNG